MGFLYPPILSSTKTPFLADVDPLLIDFSLSDFIDSDDIKHIGIRVLRQRDNSNVVSRVSYPDGIIYKPYNKEKYQIGISLSDLTIDGWEYGEIYKIQLRFGSEELWSGYPSDVKDFSSWHDIQVQQGNFGEWSNVMLAKAIERPGLSIDILDITTSTPSFYGTCSSQNDPVDVFSFTIQDGSDGTWIDVVDSGWIKHTQAVDQWTTDIVLESELPYRVIYNIKTLNGYTDTSSRDFTLEVVEVIQLKGITMSLEESNEDGYLELTIESSEELTGNYIISRTQDGKKWEDLRVYPFFRRNDPIVFRDYFIESGVKYKYGFQVQKRYTRKGKKVFVRSVRNESPWGMSNFEYSYLYADGVQLKLKFNNTMNTFKHTVLSSKQDTLGSKYPTIMRNGYAYYGEFPINGLISLHIDDNGTFFKQEKDGLYYRDELILPNSYFDYSDRDQSIIDYDIGTDLTHNNFYIERKFREKVEAFLNDGRYKVFKSPSQGTMIVSLMNIQLQPNSTVSGMVQSFSGTAYEVMDFTLQNLESIGMITAGQWEEIPTQYVEDFDQVIVSGTEEVLLIDKIREKNSDYYSLLEFRVEGYNNQNVIVLTVQTEDGQSQKIFVYPGRSYQVSNLTEAKITQIATSTPLVFNYRYLYTVEPTPEEEITEFKLEDFHFQLNKLTSEDVIQNIYDELAEQLKSQFDGKTFTWDEEEQTFTSEDQLVKVWVLYLDWINIETYPYAVLNLTVGNKDLEMNLGDRGYAKFYPRRDDISRIGFAAGRPEDLTNTLVETKISTVYRELIEVTS